MKLDISGIKLYNSKEIKKDILGRELKAGDIVAAYKKGGIVLGVFNGKSAISSASTVRTSQYLKIEHPDDAMIQTINDLNNEILVKENKIKDSTIKLDKPLTFYTYPNAEAGLVFYLGLCEFTQYLEYDKEVYDISKSGYVNYTVEPDKKDLIAVNPNVQSKITFKAHVYLTNFRYNTASTIYKAIKSNTLTYDDVIELFRDNITYGHINSICRSSKIITDKIGDGSIMYQGGIELKPTQAKRADLVELATVSNIPHLKDKLTQGIKIDPNYKSMVLSRSSRGEIMEIKRFVSSYMEIKLLN